MDAEIAQSGSDSEEESSSAGFSSDIESKYNSDSDSDINDDISDSIGVLGELGLFVCPAWCPLQLFELVCCVCDACAIPQATKRSPSSLRFNGGASWLRLVPFSAMPTRFVVD